MGRTGPWTIKLSLPRSLAVRSARCRTTCWSVMCWPKWPFQSALLACRLIAPVAVLPLCFMPTMPLAPTRSCPGYLRMPPAAPVSICGCTNYTPDQFAARLAGSLMSRCFAVHQSLNPVQSEVSRPLGRQPGSRAQQNPRRDSGGCLARPAIKPRSGHRTLSAAACRCATPRSRQPRRRGPSSARR
jgi:hypothetical protein